MSLKGTALAVLGLGILGAGTWTAWHLSQADPVAAAEEPQPAAPATDGDGERLMPMVTTGDAVPPKPQENPRDTSTMTRLPDGTYIPNLNGVREPMTWSGAPFSPIVGIRRTDKGVDWWVHENGMQSTTWIAVGTERGVPVRKAVMLRAMPQEKVFGVDPRERQKLQAPKKN